MGLCSFCQTIEDAIRGKTWAIVDWYLLTFRAKGEEELVSQGMKVLHILIDVDQVLLRCRNLAKEARVLGYFDEVDAKELVSFEDIVECFFRGIRALIGIWLGMKRNNADFHTHLEKISN